ncbi:DUF924 family protein [Rhodobacterales bacterium HKCCE3408]|nr:DUF924 family protein [Rhodobacterales bacterium HKCCE3408]
MDFRPEQVLDFWFPDDGHWEHLETHRKFWEFRMRGGVDEDICRDFGPLTEAAARGYLDDWAETPRGRLALVIALDQFPRSYWRDRPEAYGQDIKACRLVLQSLHNGHYEALPNTWERQFYIIALTHCEGPDHMSRLDLALRLSHQQREIALPHLMPIMERPIIQTLRVIENIRRFGRHAHRNPILGRISTPEEDAYIATGEFPHNTPIQVPDQNGG